MNTIPARITRTGDDTAVAIGGVPAVLPQPLARTVNDADLTDVVVGVRPEHLRIGPDSLVPATVTLIESLGHERHLVCRLDDGTTVIVRQPAAEPAPSEGAAIHLDAQPGTFHVFDAATGLRLTTA
jgi:ABC-type sugar transport system ATPase subunit